MFLLSLSENQAQGNPLPLTLRVSDTLRTIPCKDCKLAPMKLGHGANPWADDSPLAWLWPSL
ncbi:hypothetical protein SuUB81_20500 [Streptococcus uberis]